jgi:hypothetical protein
METKILDHLDAVLEQLKVGRTIRTQRTLELVHTVCKDQASRGSKDFSITMIGKLIEKIGGPKTQSIRNKEGESYRLLISEWEKLINSSVKPAARQNFSDHDQNLLAQIQDPTIKAGVGIILSELKKLRGENNLLKQAANVIIDQRPHIPSGAVEPGSLAPSYAEITAVEWKTLEHAISEDFFKKMGWQIDADNGSVCRDGRPVYRAGYLTAMKKILSHRK